MLAFAEYVIGAKKDESRTITKASHATVASDVDVSSNPCNP